MFMYVLYNGTTTAKLTDTHQHNQIAQTFSHDSWTNTRRVCKYSNTPFMTLHLGCQRRVLRVGS